MAASSPLSAKPGPRWQGIDPRWIFYLGIPALTAIVFGVNHSGSARYMSLPAGIVHWLGIIAILWLVLDLTSRLAVNLTKSLAAPRWSKVLAASLLTVLAFDPVLDLYSRLTFPVLAPNAAYVEPRSALDLLATNPLRALIMLVVPAYWLGALYICESLFGFPGYLRGRKKPGLPFAAAPFTEPAAEALPEPQEGLFSDVPLGIGTDLVSMQAEDHYVRVFTRHGEALVRYRFSDALSEMADILHGVQIHRSHWVRVGAIAQIKTIDGKRHVELDDGRRLPVSRSFTGTLRALRLI